ncbi:HNH endonuclease [Nitratireductor sp. L1-7-SE]|uniref:HNH endonuclease n=1 Tax=Nitratireductor rhodophyticola TaxID=2854036 RepID=A0ABS7RCZ1_9HYPH|nr:HNH endonuclease signature motif containing protein [Nitratireductor rhodophyticola]MBY8918784.1 HNH endonuclease [Nitratireductor rhodophyticola]MBY8920032.1 HNH endonuclease [Nitratireductor rhodophyticola]
MSRYEFTRRQRLEIWQRADGHCEKCRAKLKVGEGEYDHVIAQGYGGENTVENGQLLCRPCHKGKTAVDKGITEKTKRIRDKHLGVYPKSKAKIAGRGFQKTRG